ncbi:hypothetical protein VT03_01035 [Planctomyces sp. SH-PL14]|nr:hypothetical protein VT03_01035 [Planctomyces sp. SH-PL14]
MDDVLLPIMWYMLLRNAARGPGVPFEVLTPPQVLMACDLARLGLVRGFRHHLVATEKGIRASQITVETVHGTAVVRITADLLASDTPSVDMLCTSDC